MKKKNPAIIIAAITAIIFVAGFLIWLFFDPLHRSNGAIKITPSTKKVVRKLKIEKGQLPIIKMGLENNNHEVSLTISGIPDFITRIEYDFIYNAKDKKGREFEKGQYDSVDLEGKTKIKKTILLGTASCTTGKCRYRYDENVDSGRLLLRMKDKEDKTAQAESAFLIIYPKRSVDLSNFFDDNGNGEIKASNRGNGYILINRSPSSPQPIKTENYLGPFYVFSQTASSISQIDTKLEVQVLKNNQWQKNSKAVVSPGQFFIIIPKS